MRKIYKITLVLLSVLLLATSASAAKSSKYVSLYTNAYQGDRLVVHDGYAFTLASNYNNDMNNYLGFMLEVPLGNGNFERYTTSNDPYVGMQAATFTTGTVDTSDPNNPRVISAVVQGYKFTCTNGVYDAGEPLTFTVNFDWTNTGEQMKKIPSKNTGIVNSCTTQGNISDGTTSHDLVPTIDANYLIQLYK